MANRLTFAWISAVVADLFPDPEPENGYVRIFRAVVAVVMSAALLESTSVSTLSNFTGLSSTGVGAVAWNMRNSRLWKKDHYDAGDWLLPSGVIVQRELEEHVSIALGETHSTDAETMDSKDVYAAFGDIFCRILEGELRVTRGLQSCCTPRQHGSLTDRTLVDPAELIFPQPLQHYQTDLLVRGTTNGITAEHLRHSVSE